jgi:thiamine biosynthesis lipoprotein
MPKYLLLALVFICTSCFNDSKIHINGKTMGTTYSIKAFGENLNQVKLKSEVDDFLYAYNLKFSTYIENSELSLLNLAPTNKAIQISEELMTVIKKAKAIYKKTNGMYDVTVGPLVNRWGFGPVSKKGRPTDKEVSLIRQRVGMDNLIIKGDSVVKLKSIYIDLSSIAKGDGVDKIAKLLENKFKIKSYFVEIGGEVRVSGSKDDRGPWRVGIEKPESIKASGLQKVLVLRNESIATSGSYRNFVKYGDSVFSHVINPLTGYPVKHKTISVSVLAKDCATADAWATAFMSLGVEKSLDIAKKEGLKAFFLVKENGSIKEYKTTSFGY